MIIPDRKKTVSIILSKLSADGMQPKTQEVKNESEISPTDTALKAIAEDMLQAHKDSSAHDLMVALKAFIEEFELMGKEV